MDESCRTSVLPPVDRGSSRWIQLHRGLLRRPPDPPDHHQRDLQEATPLSVTTPTAAKLVKLVKFAVCGPSLGEFLLACLKLVGSFRSERESGRSCKSCLSEGSARAATLNQGQTDVRTQQFRDVTFAQSLSGRTEQRRNTGILISAPSQHVRTSRSRLASGYVRLLRTLKGGYHGDSDVAQIKILLLRY